MCSGNTLILRFEDKLKTTRPGFHTSEIRLPAYPKNPALNIVTTFLAFKNTTKPLRGKGHSLFWEELVWSSPVSGSSIFSSFEKVKFDCTSTRSMWTSPSPKAAIFGSKKKQRCIQNSIVSGRIVSGFQCVSNTGLSRETSIQ